jgi:pimeloyl-ACP methyl ester carboxylesterase
VPPKAQPAPPVPPLDFPPARTVRVADRGEFFLRDSGGPGPVVMLLHGWLASSDLNWTLVYDDVIAAGYRVIAIDHRGHGRGIRPATPFRLDDCAADAAAVLRTLDVGPALVFGYSMGGAIAQLMARDHPDVVAGLGLGGTAQHWQEAELRRVWKAMGMLGFSLRVFPGWTLRWGLTRTGLVNDPNAAWLRSELLRHDPKAIAEAGRELSRFDSRPWLTPLDIPSAMVLTSHDDAVSPEKQHELARALGARVFDAPIRHLHVSNSPRKFNPALLELLAFLGAETPVRELR